MSKLPPTIISADTLRTEGAMISKAVSWERTAMNLLWQLRNNAKINHYLQSPRILVTFGAEGAVYLTTKEDGAIQNPAYLYLAHGRNEGYMQNALSQEDIAALAQAIEAANGAPELPGLPYRHEIPMFPDGNTQPPETFVLAEKDGFDEMINMATNYVAGNTDALGKLPLLEIGGLKTYDRMEIEAFSIIRNALENYKNGSDTQPLTIAVFGSPGSGKSFGIRQIAKNLFGKEAVAHETFDVSQFTKPDDLAKAFRWVCDVSEQGKLPLLFLDEFDSAGLNGAALGWLKSYLAPMQEGEYYDASGKQNLPKCIIVFAGATSTTFEAFRNPDDIAFFKAQKGPDFVSRVKCVIDIAGPNPRTGGEKSYVLRRAVLLRSFMERGGITEIDDGIVQAMLLVPFYKFGARSMETIIKMSHCDDGVLRPACLPMGSQMEAHIPVRAFTNLLLLDVIENSTEGEIARQIHEEYRETMAAQGKKRPNCMPWEELSPHFKLSNINQAMNYRETLALIGCEMHPAKPDKPPLKRFTESEILVMAKREHDRWVAEKIEDGWAYAPVRNDDKKLHDCLVSWEALSEEVQGWDKDPCANMIPILGGMGYGVYRR
ncbi:MAG: RyR domain-containing protein [Oscillospiraceae bacterium]|nr:RyR domain-containing protein [Oscillospiraceae bacterium]